MERIITSSEASEAFASTVIGVSVLSAGVAMPTVDAADSYVLHAVPGNGGGVDRHVRDICMQRSNDCILHIARAQCVFEVVRTKRLLPIDYADMPHAVATGALGRPALIHAHSTLAPVRDRVRQLCRALAIDYVLTLHDIDFAAAAVDVGDGEREARLAFVSNASARIAPSTFILNLLHGALGSSVTGQLIENGVNPDAPVAVPIDAAGNNSEKQFQVAVIGALGTHKGLVFLHDVVAALPKALRVVILGYADGQVTPGWLQPDRLWVHGAFETAELAAIVRGYGVTLAFFPNRQPESYCYALSDAWCAGLPALGPASGAIGDRIAATGAGWTFKPDSTAQEVAEQLIASLRVAGKKNIAVRRAVEQLFTPVLMIEQLGHIYAKHMKSTHTPPKISALESVAATQLNGSFFRGELLRLSGDIAFSQAQAAQADASFQSLTHEFYGRGEWIATLEKSLADVQAELRRVEAARQAEHLAAAVAREDERTRSAAARDQERVASQSARDCERTAADAALHLALHNAAIAHAEDRADIEAARQAEHLVIAVAREDDRARSAAARDQERAASETARDRERTAAEAALHLALYNAATAHTKNRADIEAAREKERADATNVRAQFEATLAQMRAEFDGALHSERVLAEAALVERHAAHVQYAAKLQRDVNDTLTIAHRYEKTIVQYDRALSALPSILRRWAFKRADR